MPDKVIIIGIDGGTWTILKPAMEQGFMPYLQQMVNNGASGILKSTIPAITPAAWSSFQTGRTPGQHGIHDFAIWDKINKNKCSVSSSELQNTIWELAGNAGKKVGVLNVPVTYPPKKINGEMVSGLFAPDVNCNFTWPPELKEKLLEAVKGYDILNHRNNSVYPSKTSVEDFVSLMNQNIDWRMQAAKFMISRNDFDLFMVHFHASDIIQHGLWGFMDPTHELFDKNKQNYILKNFYGRLDNHIAEVCNSFEQKTQNTTYKFIISDHGFQSNLMQVNMATWLLQNGYINENYICHNKNIKKINKKPAPLVALAKKIGVGKFIGHFLPEKAVRSIEHHTNLKNKYSDFNYDGCLVSYSGGCQYGFIYFLCDSEQEKSRLFNELSDKFHKLKDPADNSDLVQQIYTREQLFSGERCQQMPDMTIVLKDKWSMVFDSYNSNIIEKVDFNTTKHVGTHHQDGILIVNGNGVTAGTKADFDIIDVAPTVMKLLNIKTDRQIFDGKVMTGIWSDNSILDDNNSVSTATDTNNQPSSSRNVMDNDLSKRLSDLGYM